jgi:hypothetical protein
MTACLTVSLLGDSERPIEEIHSTTSARAASVVYTSSERAPELPAWFLKEKDSIIYRQGQQISQLERALANATLDNDRYKWMLREQEGRLKELREFSSKLVDALSASRSIHS